MMRRVWVLGASVAIGLGGCPTVAVKNRHDPACLIDGLQCSRFSSSGATGRGLLEQVARARADGDYERAICLSNELVTSRDRWLAGAAFYERSAAWDKRGRCHERAVAEARLAAAIRPMDKSGWKETCALCSALGARCEACPRPGVPVNQCTGAINVLADGEFANLGEHHLGALFRDDLKPLPGQYLFDAPTTVTTPRRDADHSILRLSSNGSIGGKADLMVMGIDLHGTANHSYALLHSKEIIEVVEVEPRSPRRTVVPSPAAFYLSHVRKGSYLDYVIEGDEVDMGAKLDLTLKQSLSLQALASQHAYKIDLRYRGLRAIDADSVRTVPIDEIRQRYAAESVPIELVFTPLDPDHHYPCKLDLEPPEFDDQIQLRGTQSWQYRLLPGRYELTSKSASAGHLLSWSNKDLVQCNRTFMAQSDEFAINCDVLNDVDLNVVTTENGGCNRSSISVALRVRAR